MTITRFERGTGSPVPTVTPPAKGRNKSPSRSASTLSRESGNSAVDSVRQDLFSGGGRTPIGRTPSRGSAITPNTVQRSETPSYQRGGSASPGPAPSSIFRPGSSLSQPRLPKREIKKRRFAALLARMREENTTTENVAWWDLDSDQVIELINIALMCPDLQTLYLDGNNLGAGGLSGISTLVLSPETNLVELSLTDNAISSHGLKTVANGLRVNKTIRRVNLRNNECTAQGADYSGVQALADSLNNTGEPGISCNTTLLSLDISGNLLADQGALYVVEIFEKNMTLLELDLASNSIRDEGINAIVAALGVGIASGSKLSSCDLTDNYGMTRKVDGKISKLLAKNLSKRRALERHARGHSRAHRGCHLVPWHLMTEEVLPDPATLRRSPAKKKVAAGGDVEYDDED